ncbi:MAG: sugar ABC transporter substrate-binding protein [Bordetella sp.]|uniref:sugar ABC transporter substrate-binding protein n=1 Tax=Bordetella sp. TaxID=28081 RepID=UPI003F7CA1E9
MKNRIGALTFLLASCLLSCTAGSQPQKVWHVGVLYWSSTIPGQVAMRQGLEQEIDRINQAARRSGAPTVQLWTEVAGDGPQSVDRQIAQMHKMVQARPDLIIVQPTDNAALTQPLLEADRAGIPVVAYDQYISGGRLAAYVASDNYQAGYLDGEYLVSLFQKKTPLRLVLVEYPEISSAADRVSGFLDALQNYGRAYTILKAYRAFDALEGAKVGAALLRDFPQQGSIDAVFTVNDGAGLPVVDALARAGRDEIDVATVGGNPASVQNIRDKRLTRIDSAQFCGPLGARTAQTAYAILSGKDVPARILVPTFPVTAETLDKYPGWSGPIPAPFQKPWPAQHAMWQNKAMGPL